MRNAAWLVVLSNAEAGLPMGCRGVATGLEPRPAGKFLARVLRRCAAKSENRRLLPGGVNASKV